MHEVAAVEELAGGADIAGQGGVVAGKGGKAFAESGYRTGGEGFAVDAVLDEFQEGGIGGGENWGSEGHGLQDDVRAAFAAFGGEDEERGIADEGERGGIGDFAGETDACGGGAGSGQILEAQPLGAAADDEQIQGVIGLGGEEALIGVEEEADGLFRFEAAGADDKGAGIDGRRAGEGGESVRVDRIGNDGGERGEGDGGLAGVGELGFREGGNGIGRLEDAADVGAAGGMALHPVSELAAAERDDDADAEPSAQVEGVAGIHVNEVAMDELDTAVGAEEGEGGEVPGIAESALEGIGFSGAEGGGDVEAEEADRAVGLVVEEAGAVGGDENGVAAGGEFGGEVVNGTLHAAGGGDIGVGQQQQIHEAGTLTDCHGAGRGARMEGRDDTFLPL